MPLSNNGQSTVSVLYICSDSKSSKVVNFLKTRCSNVYCEKGASGARSIIGSNRVEILIINLEENEGPRLAKELKESNPDFHIILVSKYGDSKHLLEAIEIGIDSYIVEPIDFETLERTLNINIKRALNDKYVEEVKKNLNQYQKVIDSTAIYSKTDTKGKITYANRSFCEISGYTEEELVGQPHNIVRHPDMQSEAFADLWKTIKKGNIWKGVIKNLRKDGSAYTVDSTIIPIVNTENEITEFIGIRHDITNLYEKNRDLTLAQKKNRELLNVLHGELESAFFHDENTGLLNILSLQEDLKNYEGGAFFLLDVDNFNIYNKVHGFQYGDKILKEIGRGLKSLAGEDEKVYKMSADRFAILYPSYSEDLINFCVEKVNGFFDTHEIVVDTIENLVTFSMGIAKVENGVDTIINAEFALDISKKHGKKFKLVYDKESSNIQQERNSIIRLKNTREYILKDMIIPYYQPIVNVQTKEVVKYEALARVIDDNGDLITPDMFLSSASRLGMLSSITKSMINKTFKHFSGTDIKFSVNITERDILDNYLVDFINIKSRRFDIDLKNVTFEILENITLSDKTDSIVSTISHVKNYGCKIAIDDFGTESSNFSRLLSLQSDFIKIDGSFVDGCEEDEEKQKIIDAIVQLSKRLGMETVAEYVHSEAIYEVVKDLGVNLAQGFYFGRPQSYTDIR